MRKMMKRKNFLFATLLASIGISGCAETRTQEILTLLESNEQIEIAISIPNGAEELQGTPTEWKALSYLTDQDDLRISIDDILGIVVYGESKNGMLYVNPETEEWEPNNTLENVYKNEIFTETLEDADVTEKLNAAVLNAYVDLEETTDEEELRLAVLNAYFNIFPADEDTAEFNGDAYLSRALFMSGMAKAHLPAVEELKASEDAIEQLGDTEYTAYAELVSDYAYLDLASKSLNSKNFKGLITRAEVAYIIANIYYSDELANINPSEKSAVYRDIKNAGNMSEEISGMEQYKAANMQYMVEHSWKGLDEDLYKAMVVCYNHGVFGNSSESRWDEPITKVEALETLENVYTDLGTTVDCLYGNNQKVEITAETKFNELVADIIYTLDGNEYVMDELENAGSLWFLKRMGHLPYVTYSEWRDKVNSMIYPFDDWMKLSASKREETLGEHMYSTIKNHISWSEADGELDDLTADQNLWLYMISEYELDEYTFNTCKDFYEEFGLSTIEEARMYEATNLNYMKMMYNTVAELDTMSEEEREWENQVVALEEKEHQQYLASIQNQANSASVGSSNENSNAGNQTVYKNDWKNVGDIVMSPYWGCPVVMCYYVGGHKDYDQCIETRTIGITYWFLTDGMRYIISYTEDESYYYVTYNDGGTETIEKVVSIKRPALIPG